jgi:tetratricopeptide (TPR) repeat protein
MQPNPPCRNRFLLRASRTVRTFQVGGACLWFLALPLLAGDVHVREETLTLPSYGVGEPDRNPRFYQGRTYQGARGSFYPYPVQDHLTGERADQDWKAVYLENDHVQICVLPEIGGRIFTAIDKSNGYDFFYRQQVIKPALIGMLGAWISGGVEWNVPHHHRASSFMPVDWVTEEHPNGSKTIWVGEIERRHRMKWLVGMTLHPDRSFLELTVKLFNRSPVAHSFLFWINPAVHANEHYQVIFPPSTEWTVQHAKPEFASWPIARQFYGGVDYTRGVDISWWKNHPSPVSFFAWDSQEDFFGGYDHGRQAGVVHVADRHAVPGKKFFEWGNGPAGEMWETILTDEDGPYLELMAGAYSDNQPDYSWCQPGEVKTWKHYWYPVRNLGGFKNANTDAALNLDFRDQSLHAAFNTTARHRAAQLEITAGNQSILSRTLEIGPDAPFQITLPLPAATDPLTVRAALLDDRGRLLIAYRPQPRSDAPMPKPVQRPAPPAEVQTLEELYLTGLRIEQLYSPAFEPDPYYEEALRRDPNDYRANTALGILYCKRGRFDAAEKKLRTAISQSRRNYIRPKDSEADYYLGVALRAQANTSEARDAFHAAAWNPAWRAASCFALAELACQRGDWTDALEHAERSLAVNALDPRLLAFKASILRQTGHRDEAAAAAESALALDPLEFRGWNELRLARAVPSQSSNPATAPGTMRQRMRDDVQSYLELAVDYGNGGFYLEAMELLEDAAHLAPGDNQGHPMVYYFFAHYAEAVGKLESASRARQLARTMSTDYCFPHRWEAAPALQQAIAREPNDARAPYYLGNLLYDHQPEAAIAAWELSRARDPQLALTHRNLGLAYAEARADLPQAIASLEQAAALNPSDARLLYELDLICEAAGLHPAARLARLEQHHQTVNSRDDAVTRLIILLTQQGMTDRALELLQNRQFHNWEGSGEIREVFVDALLTRGLRALRQRQPESALRDFQSALEFPRNLAVGRPKRDSRGVQIHCLIGDAQSALDRPSEATKAYSIAADESAARSGDAGYYRACALLKLDRKSEADRVFEALIAEGRKLLAAPPSADYFAKFGEKESARARQARAHYWIALGEAGLGHTEAAISTLERALQSNPAHLWAGTQLELLLGHHNPQ